jgi:hypothetical protein
MAREISGPHDLSSWVNLGGLITATNATMTASDAAPPDPTRFYRLVLMP